MSRPRSGAPSFLLEEDLHDKSRVRDVEFGEQRAVPVRFNAVAIPEKNVLKVLNEWRAFEKWRLSVSEHPEMVFDAIEFISIDMFGPKVGFCEFWLENLTVYGKKEDGHVFMRGDSVAILMVLTCEGEDFTVLTMQARVPAGMQSFPEIPAGMMNNGGSFSGTAATELKEETGIVITQDDLIDLTKEAFGEVYGGMVPSASLCDEEIQLFLCMRYVTRKDLEELRDKVTGETQEGEHIILRVVPLADLWQIAPDAKSLSALVMYHQLKESGVLLRYPQGRLEMDPTEK